MNALMRFQSAVPRDPEIDAWFVAPDHEQRRPMQVWFERMRACGPDVRELLHDGRPTACVADAAFAYVDAFTAHGDVGFFLGAELDDPKGLLAGSGRRMRHVKLRWGASVDADALAALIDAAYEVVLARLRDEG